MGKFEQIIEARQRLCENEIQPQVQPQARNFIADHLSQDSNVLPAYQKFAQTGFVDPTIKQTVDQYGGDLETAKQQALQAMQQQQTQAQPQVQPQAQPQTQTQQPAQQQTQPQQQPAQQQTQPQQQQKQQPGI